jgi:addiction module RelE/StbE family toxin
MVQVLFTAKARADLLEAWIYIAEDNLTAADTVLDTIDQESAILLQQPLMGRARPELGHDVRSWPTSTPYILYYEVEGGAVTILRVLHHARDIRLATF